MKTSSDDKFSFRDIPSPIFKGFLERFKSSGYFMAPGVWVHIPCHFSSNEGTRTWQLDYYPSYETLTAIEYDNSPIKDVSYKLDGADGVKLDFSIRTGEMKLLRKFEYKCNIAVSRKPQFHVIEKYDNMVRESWS